MAGQSRPQHPSGFSLITFILPLQDILDFVLCSMVRTFEFVPSMSTLIINGVPPPPFSLAIGSQTDYGSIFNPCKDLHQLYVYSSKDNSRIVAFPSTCPYVTSVRATQINPGMKVTDQESPCEQVIFSGGGFSSYLEMPKYQSKAMENYLENHKPQEYGAEVWNATVNVSKLSK